MGGILLKWMYKKPINLVYNIWYMSKLPEFLKPYFWDVTFAELDSQKNEDFIVHRLLDKGNLQATKWVTKNYPPDSIRTVLKTWRDFSLKNASFWSLLYQVPLSEVKCFQEPYRTMRKKLWPY